MSQVEALGSVCTNAQQVADPEQSTTSRRPPEGARRQAQGASYRGKQAISPTGPPTDQNTHFCKQEEENWAKSETNYSWRSTNLDGGYASREG